MGASGAAPGSLTLFMGGEKEIQSPLGGSLQLPPQMERQLPCSFLFLLALVSVGDWGLKEWPFRGKYSRGGCLSLWPPHSWFLSIRWATSPGFLVGKYIELHAHLEKIYTFLMVPWEQVFFTWSSKTYHMPSVALTWPYGSGVNEKFARTAIDWL